MSTSSAKVSQTAKQREDVVSHVQGMLQVTLDKAIDNLQALDTERNDAGPNPQPKLATFVQGLEKRLHAIQAIAAETDQAVADGSKAVREYLKRAENMRGKLAEWASQ